MKGQIDEKKIKIGLACNKIATVLFVLFFVDVCVIPIMEMTFFLISVAVIVILFAVCCITAHICLKDYKQE
ncbi:hypothetical protein [uncultured Eubacterium sp.]|uniref:hypothetical protein n=1 Tax=uncultured Eubacterium sp. TaxID=165185 RepID=UPI0026733EF8|nr:hypothetical protein [uncultured Eubacterium sp.]